MKSVFLIGFASVALWAQAPATPAAPPAAQQDAPEQQTRRSEVYVRRFSFGVNVSANLPGPTKNESLQQSFTTTPALEVRSNNSGKSSMLGLGAVFQVALTNHWAVAVSPSIRTRVKFESLVVRLVGTDNINTIQDDREGTNLNVNNSARFLDIPILARYYGKSRFERGPRWFAEVGPRMRRAYAVRTTTHVQPPPNKGDAYDLTTPVGFKKSITGASAGFGMQFVDDFGIRFVPEVRYTRWFGSTFGDVNGRSRQHQVEIVFNLTF
jgi:hypothetical protein